MPGFSYSWQDAVTLVGKMVKSIPTSTLDAQVCDMVSGEIYHFRPWSWTITSGTVCTPTDGNQEFSGPAQLYRLVRARWRRTDTTPDQYIELNARQSLPPDLITRSYNSISAISYEEGIGLIRLGSAVQIPTETTLAVEGEWQTVPTKITATSQQLFFPDQYIAVACEGLLYWYYKLADDPRAGGKAVGASEQTVYSGQYANFVAAMMDMAKAEDYPALDNMFPDEPFGIGGRYSGTPNIFGVM